MSMIFAYELFIRDTMTYPKFLCSVYLRNKREDGERMIIEEKFKHQEFHRKSLCISNGEDETVHDFKRILMGNCHFYVKYMGKQIVSSSRGAYFCSTAIQSLHDVKKTKIKATLHISMDGLRLTTDGKYPELLIDQIPNSISFCSSDERYPQYMAMICVDEVTNSNICHAFKVEKIEGKRVCNAIYSAIWLSRRNEKQFKFENFISS
ncbi:hypothetical protein ACOME3_000844 [Neoechinorhynchus agilis]